MTDRPRLFLVTESPAPSGVGEHMLTLAEGLRGDHDIVVAATPASGLLARARACGLTVKAIDPGNVPDLSRWFARAQPDIVHVHAGIGWEGHASAQAAHAAGARVIRTEHLPYLLTDADQCAAHRAGLTHVDRLIAVSDAVADSHRQAELGNRLTTIPNGVVPPPASTRPRATLRRYWALDDGPVLLMAARFAEQKGHRLILDAMPAIRAVHPHATLLLAGDGPLKWTIAREIAGCGLAGSVRMLGQRDDMPDLMAAADLLVLPSRFEGLSLVALEAMAAGLPIVASDAPGNAEMLEHGRSGWLTPAGDADAFAATVIDALADRDRLRAVAIAASDHQRDHYDADRMIRDTAAIYAEETSGAPRPDGKRMTRIGFIGAGGIAHRHFGVLEQFDDVAIVAIADVDQSRADEAAARFGAQAFTDIDAMLDAVPVDALYICVPPFAHGAPERAAIARGLPFFVEKPVALDIATADAIAAEIAAANIVTAVGYHWRYLDTVDEVRGLLAHNPARLMSGYWLDSTPPPQWWWHADQSGGQMVEQTTHLIDLARYLAGDVTRVFGLAGHTDRAEFPGLDVPTVSTASLQFGSGAIANFASTCLLGWNHRVGLHLFGDRLAVELTDRDLMVDVGRGRPVRGAQGDPVWHEDRDFIDAVQGKENRIRCPYADAVETHRVALAIGESARTGTAIVLGTGA
ncbi:glycosyltransferase [Sphingomonas mollis]|uniref:Glycosyltransferase n=1 Tax=Sphingomonas mollis TaxID=2795726 RepID=A0ABS0XTA8_9SPHN|nr:glycosyltransferase [Sphingomonas sp. BT553]MBJ6123284.1 glycosyltransferase [Sphingomonas sp. BT553]